VTGGGYSSSATPLTGGTATINIPAGSLATGSDTLTANYTPDSSSSSTYNSATGSAPVSVSQTPAATFAFTNSGNITVIAGASTGNTSTISATPANGFTGTISLSCAITSSPSNATDPVTCSLPPSVSITDTTAATATLIVNSTAATSSALDSPFRFLVPGGGFALAVLCFFGVPARRRSWSRLVGVLFVLFAAAAIGCGGSSGSASTPPPSGGSPRTTAGAYMVTVTGTSGTLTQTTTVVVTVN
jgi:hypothetical protein